MNTNTKILETLEKEIKAAGVYTGYSGSFFDKTIEMLRQNIREETATKSGAKKPYKIIEAMLKTAKRDQPSRTFFQKAHEYGNKYGFLDGYRLFLSDDPFGYESINVANGAFKIDQLFNVNDYDLKTIEIDTAELRYFAKISKSRSKWDKVPYIIRTSDGFAGFNPNFLIDLIEYTGSNKIRYQKRTAPIYSEDMQALLLPVNCRDMQTETDYQEYRQKWFNENKTEEAAA